MFITPPFLNIKDMPCTGLAISAPNISCLNYNLHWDLSGATPIVTITNTSTVNNYANLKWWFYVVSPNGAAIYGEDLNTVSPLPTPDVNAVSWTTKQITLQTPFGNPPCGQIEFSPTNPYNVFVYVQDIGFSTSSFFTYSKNTLIPRPGGNNRYSCGNYGTAAVSMQVDCANKNIMVFDSTILIYNNILTPASSSNKWTLVYPEDPSGDIPNVVVNNQANVNFPVSVNSEGYVLYFDETATFDYGDGITITVKYKLFTKGSQVDQALGQQFAVACNTNLCLLQCQMQKFYKLSQGTCGALENAALINKMTQMSFIFNQIITGIFQPLCGINIPKLMAEIKAIGNFADNCDCNCGGGNFGFSNPTGSGASSSSCCPIYTTVLVIDTTDPPANCPNGYFPASVYDPTGVSIIGVALSMPDEIGIINANAAWQVYGTAFDAGNCKVGFFPRTGVVTVPPVYVNPVGDPGPSGGGGGVVIVPVVDPAGYPPTTCPSGYFPAQVYDPTGAIIIGVAYNIADVIGIINANAAWNAIGTAFVVDNCHVGFYPTPGVVTFPPVVVTYTGGGGGGVTTDCVSTKQLYPVTVSDICYPKAAPITVGSFPLNVYVDFGLGAGQEYAGNATSQANMIALLNAMSDKPATITFIAGPTPDQVIINNSDCTGYSGVISINTDAGSNSYLLYSGTHTGLLGATTVLGNQERAFSIKSLTDLGGLIGTPTGDPIGWHTIKIGNVLMVSEPSGGKINFWDVTNPLMPTLSRTITLNAVVGDCFTGSPQSETIASATNSPTTDVDTIYDLYFPTDYYATMSLNAIYVVESLTGCIWKLDYFGSGTGIVASFQDDQLIGKCPRVLIGNQLFFTQDGDLEQATGQSSTVAVGDIVILDITTFNSGGLSTMTVFLNHIENVWSASYDGAGRIYFVGEFTSIGLYTIASGPPPIRYLYAGGIGLQMSYRANSVYYLGNLYVTPQHLPSYNGMIIDVSTLGGVVSIGQFDVPTGSTINGMFNFIPLGNCLGVLTSARVPGDSPAHIALYFLDGTYVERFTIPSEEEYYNVIPIPNVPVTTPNNFV